MSQKSTLIMQCFTTPPLTSPKVLNDTRRNREANPMNKFHLQFNLYNSKNPFPPLQSEEY